MELYEGTFTRDLFAEEDRTYFDDFERFMSLQREAVEEKAEELRERFDWVESTEAPHIPCWECRPADEGERGGAIINLRPNGKVEIREGLARPEEAEGEGAEAESEPAPRPDYSKALVGHIAFCKSAAVLSALLEDGRKAKEVAVAQLDGRRCLQTEPHACLAYFAGNEEASSDAYRKVEREMREALPEELTADGDHLWAYPWKWSVGEKELFNAVRAMSDEQLDRLLPLLPLLTFGQRVCSGFDEDGESPFNQVAEDLGVDMREHWTPDEFFLKRRTKAQLAEIADETGASAAIGGKPSRLKKGDLIGCILRHFQRSREAEEPAPHEREALEWLPGPMRFPARS